MPVPIDRDGESFAQTRMRRLRVSAYVVCIDGSGRALLARWVGPTGPKWTLPGGGLDFGEQPHVAALRELHEETGYVGVLDALVGIDEEHFVGPRGDDFHAVRVVYRGHVSDGVLTHELNGSTDQAAWVSPDELAGLDAVALVDAGLGLALLPGRPVPAPTPASGAVGIGHTETEIAQQPRLRVGAIVRDASGALLVVRPSQPVSSDRWQLPGGFVEHGEPLEVALYRTTLTLGIRLRINALRAATSETTRDEPGGSPGWLIRFAYEAELAEGFHQRVAEAGQVEFSWVDDEQLADLPPEPNLRQSLG